MYTETHTLILSEDGLAAHRSLALVRTKIGAAGLRPTRPRFESVFYETSGGPTRQAPPSNTICHKKRERGAERPHTRDHFCVTMRLWMRRKGCAQLQKSRASRERNIHFWEARNYLIFVICNLLFVICYLLFVICY